MTRFSTASPNVSPTFSCPTYSPELFPIEHIWDLTRWRFRLTSDHANLTHQLELVWQEILQEDIYQFSMVAG
ncbi:hypothetical protein TNCV_2231561 [Trichonephila clavipes]|nr:hypothetical protein TNCV_2231561 [Trichonephila clavipes]